MKAAVVYESMFGNTRAIAEAVAEGLAEHDARVFRVGELQPHDLDDVRLLVVGGPTHAWGLSRPKTRKAAEDQAAEARRGLTLEPLATGRGLREWLADGAPHALDAAAFDTRVAMPKIVTGAASRSVARLLRHNSCRLVVKPESFVVTKENKLVAGELARARRWGSTVAASVSEHPVQAPTARND